MPPKKTTQKKKTTPQLSAEEMKKILELHSEEASPWRVFKIMTEFVAGFDFLQRYGKAVTFFGSARFKPQTRDYKETEKLAEKLAKAGFAVITGGGPGVMEAANKGAFKAGGQSLGFTIQLPSEQRKNKYITESQPFYYFFVRKVMLAFASEVYVFFPGGFGTLDEFSEIVTLIQTKKINPVPIILVDKNYWGPLLEWVEKTVYEKYKGIDKADMQIYHLVDNADQAWELIQKLAKEKKLQRSDVH